MINSRLILFFILSVIPLKGFVQANLQPISHYAIHQRNQVLFAQIIEQEIKKLPPLLTAKQQADALNRLIGSIASQALERGLDLSIYQNKTLDSGEKQFSIVSLWEGGEETQQKIPLTFFLYIWPPEAQARRICRNSIQYATPIHGHPIACALAILKGKLDQETYYPISAKSLLAKKIKNETLKPGDVVIDDRSSVFVHRLVCRDKEVAFSLHGYEALNEEAVRQIFSRTYSQYVYQPINK